jgi:pimeloyl-ACP methyl ester carboxylesterase
VKKDKSTNGQQVRQTRFRRIVLWSVLTVGFLVVIYFGIGVFAANLVTGIGEHPQYSNTPETYGHEYRDVRFHARQDGTEIAAWYIPSEGSSHAVILVHGRNASKQNAISGNFPKIGTAINNAGYAVLMIDMRGHGESEGERYSFGKYERLDVLGAVDWLLEEGFVSGDISVLGISMGGAAAIGAAAEEPAIGTMVVESTFADLNPLIEAKWQEESGLPRSFLPGVLLMTRLMHGYDLSKIQPLHDIRKIPPRPVLIIHCVEDIEVPVWHAEELKKAAPLAQHWYVSECEHAEIYRDHPQDYENELLSFFKENLK